MPNNDKKDELGYQARNNSVAPDRKSGLSQDVIDDAKAIDSNSEQDNSSTSDNDSSKQNQGKGKEDSAKKAAKTGAKVAANYFAPGVGGKVVDVASKSKLGNAVLNKGAQLIKQNKQLAKAANALDKAGATDAIDKASDMQGGGGKNSTPGQNSVPTGDQGAQADSGSDSSSTFGGKKKKNQEQDEGGESSVDFKGLFSGSVVIKVIAFSLIFAVMLFLILLFVIINIVSGVADFADAANISFLNGEETGGLGQAPSDKNEQAFYDRVTSVKNQFQRSGRTVDPLRVVAVYHILNRHNSKYNYEYMTVSRISTIASAMFQGNSYSEETFRANLRANVFPSYFPDYSDKQLERLVDEVFQYIEDYYDLIDKDDSSSCGAVGTCTYDIKGFWISGRGNVAQEMQITNLKVELLDCGGRYGGTWGQLLANEEQVDFEKYILGVAYQEIGPSSPDEAIKAQMIAARSYILSRPTAMGNAQGRMLEQQNGNWILRTPSCTADQVYCDPDQGCSANSGGGQWGVVHSGTSYAIQMKPPMAEDHKMRTLASEVQGEVLVNEQGYVINAGYVQTEQTTFISLANQGLNYKQILLQVYNGGTRNYGASDIEKMNCNNGSGSGCGTISTGDFSTWKQMDSRWASIQIGSSSRNIGGVGCLVTSVSMLIAKSGVDVTVAGEFNPGTFVQTMNATGGFIGANFVWGAVSNAAPNFHFVSKMSISGYSREQKLSQIQSLIDQGYYVVAEVKGNTGQHWVAIDSINGSTVNMMDPASQSTNMWEQYNWVNTSQLAYFRVG